MNTADRLTTLIKGDIGIKITRMLAVAAFSILTAVSSAHADSSPPRFRLPYVGGNVGTGKVQTSDRFDISPAANAYGGFYLVNNFSAELWLAYLGQFDVKGQKDTYSQSSGVGTALAYRIDTGKLFALRPSVGAFYSQTKIVLQGNEIGKDRGASLVLGLSGVFTIRNHLLVNINTHFYKDVSGADILLFTVGAGYQF